MHGIIWHPRLTVECKGDFFSGEGVTAWGSIIARNRHLYQNHHQPGKIEIDGHCVAATFRFHKSKSQWIGLREILQEAPYLMVKSMVSCKFPQQTNPLKKAVPTKIALRTTVMLIPKWQVWCRAGLPDCPTDWSRQFRDARTNGCGTGCPGMSHCYVITG